jgi:hypothetical protein
MSDYSVAATCLLCRAAAWFLPEVGDTIHRGSCKTCGKYEVAWEVGGALQSSRRAPDLPLLSSYVRRTYDAGGIARITKDNLRTVVDSVRALSVSTKIRLTLEAVARHTRVPGDWLQCGHGADFTLLLQRRAGASGDVELDYLLDALVAANELLKGKKTELPTGDWCVIGSPISVSPRGWAALESTGAFGVPGYSFVAMSFSADLNGAYTEGIHPALETDCGLIPRRVDRIEHVDSIDDRIVMELRRSQSVVADFTGHRAGVYFEAGFALGLGRPVIWTCRRDDMHGLHFDTRQYNFIAWESPSGLREALTRRLRALGIARKLQD